MTDLRVLSRATFICNVCFVFSVLLLTIRHPPGGGMISLLIVMGFVLSSVLNVLTNSLCAIRWLRTKRLPVPPWLVAANIIFFVVQVILFSL